MQKDRVGVGCKRIKLNYLVPMTSLIINLILKLKTNFIGYLVDHPVVCTY